MSEERKDWEVSCWSCKSSDVCGIYLLAIPLAEELERHKEMAAALLYEFIGHSCDKYDPYDKSLQD